MIATMTSSDGPRGPGRPARATEEQVLDTALKSFAELGFEGTSVRALNSQLGLSRNSIEQRFGTKDQLWYRAVDHGFGSLASQLNAAEAADDDPSDDHLVQLRRRLHRFMSISVEHPILLRLMNLEGIHDSEHLDYIFETYIRPALTSIEEHLVALRAAGRVRPVTMRTLFLLLAHGAVAPYTLIGLSDRFDEFDGAFDPAEHIDVATEILVEGLLQR